MIKSNGRSATKSIKPATNKPEARSLKSEVNPLKSEGRSLKPVTNDVVNLDVVPEGFEEFSQSNVAFPLIKLIQKTSDDLLTRNKTARIGDFYHTVNDLIIPGDPGLVVSLI